MKIILLSDDSVSNVRNDYKYCRRNLTGRSGIFFKEAVRFKSGVIGLLKREFFIPQDQVYGL